MSRARIYPEGTSAAQRRAASDALRISQGYVRLPPNMIGPEAAAALAQLVQLHGSVRAAIEHALITAAASPPAPHPPTRC